MQTVVKKQFVLLLNQFWPDIYFRRNTLTTEGGRTKIKQKIQEKLKANTKESTENKHKEG